jgi:hypothetical protein
MGVPDGSRGLVAVDAGEEGAAKISSLLPVDTAHGEELWAVHGEPIRARRWSVWNRDRQRQALRAVLDGFHDERIDAANFEVNVSVDGQRRAPRAIRVGRQRLPTGLRSRPEVLVSEPDHAPPAVSVFIPEDRDERRSIGDAPDSVRRDEAGELCELGHRGSMPSRHPPRTVAARAEVCPVRGWPQVMIAPDDPQWIFWESGCPAGAPDGKPKGTARGVDHPG